MGWAVFFKFKGALCNKYIAIKYRMALFVSCVTPCVLYACGTWTMTSDRNTSYVAHRDACLDG